MQRLLVVCALFTAGIAAASEAPAPSPAAPPPPALAPQAPPPPERLPDGFRVAPRDRIVLSNLFVLRLNPVGIEDQIRLGWQRRLLDRRSLVLRDTFVFVGIAPRLNPAFAKIGPSIEIQPVSLLNLRVAAEYVGYFSSFGFLQSYGSPLDAYSDDVLKAGQDARRNYATGGAHVVFELLLQGRVGPIVLRNKLAFEYWYMSVRPGDTVFYDITLDTLVPANGWVLADDLDLLWVSKFGLTAGLRYSAVKPLYSASDFRPGEDRALEDNGHQRLGPFLAYTFFDRGFTRFNKPTLLLIVNWYVDHRYRTGGAPSTVVPGSFVQSAGFPYLVLGFAFQSDLFARR